MNDRPVLIDTSAWIDHDHGIGLALVVEHLIRSHRVLTTPPVVAELLRGARKETARRRYRLLLDVFPVAEPGSEDWIKAGEAAAQFDCQGSKNPLLDFLLASLAARLGSPILTSDPHFRLIAPSMGAKLHPVP